MTKIKRPWKATKMVKMNARGQSSSTSITRTPMIQVMPITTVREIDTFNQCLYSVNSHTIKMFSNISSSPHSLNSIFAVLSLLVSVHDNNRHYKEANVSQEDQNHRNDK